jgi:isopentenyl phosphate kinase
LTLAASPAVTGWRSRARKCALAELVFVKFGGSLITEKSEAVTARPQLIRRLADEVRQARQERPDLQLLLGHGSGSFGHVVAQEYGVQRGCSDWQGYALTGAVAARLNRIVTDGFLESGVPVVSLQPSASALCRAGNLVDMAWEPLSTLLAQGLVPMVYGDVALDEVWGTTIASTEMVFDYLARQLRPSRILLLGEVDGVYTGDPRVDPSAKRVPILQADRLEGAEPGLGGSHAVDVTGGMRSKVLLMAATARALPGLRVHIVSGLAPGSLYRALCAPDAAGGTLITA